jgi:hypothetical protein
MTIFRYASQAIRLLQNNSNNSSGNEVSSARVKLLCRQLRHNEIEELELGWQPHEFHYTRKEIQAICQSLYDNEESSIRSVSIGWRLKQSALDAFLPAITTLPQLQTLTLHVHTHLSESSLKNICRNKTLQQMEIRGARMRTEAGVVWNCPDDRYQMEDYCYEDVNIVGILAHLSHSRTFGLFNLQKLKLINCNIQDEHIEELCRHRLALDQLCLAGNAGITSKGLALLLENSPVQHLDLSECGVESLDNNGVMEALESESCTVQELVLKCNYEIADSKSFLSFSSAACQRLRHLDLSFCNLSGHHLSDIFQILKRMKSECRLQSLVLDGCRTIPGPALCDMLAENDSLQRLVLYRKRLDNKPQLSLKFYSELAELLKKNDTLKCLNTGDALPVELNRLLELNRAGRRILKDGQEGDWSKVLANAACHQEPDNLYWFVRNGAGVWWQ